MGLAGGGSHYGWAAVAGGGSSAHSGGDLYKFVEVGVAVIARLEVILISLWRSRVCPPP